jgi:hypothetical protein
MDRKHVLKKMSYTSQLNTPITNEKVLVFLGFSQSPNHSIEHILEKINYHTTLELPSFQEEVEKLTKKTKTEEEEEQPATS